MPKREIDGVEYDVYELTNESEGLIDIPEDILFDEPDHFEATNVYFVGEYATRNFVDPPHKSISVSNSIFSEDVILTNSEYRSIAFKNCIFEKNVIFTGGDYTDDVIFNGGSIKGKFEIRGGNFKQLFLLSANCNELYITGGKFTNLSINSYGHSELFTINDLVILNQGIPGNISISRMNIVSTNLWGNIHKDAELSFKNISFTHMKIEGLFNNGKLRFFDLVPVEIATQKPSLFIMNSNLSKTELFSIPINKVSRFELSNSFLIDCTFVNVTWPDEFNAVMKGAHYSALLDRKEMLRQLKYSYSKQGDSVMEHKFHGLEMDIYRQYLKQKRRTLKVIGKYSKWRIDRQTSIILWFSSWTSNYGQSFKAPLYTLLAAGIVLFSGMVICGFIKDLQGGFHFNYSWQSISATIGHFVSFINPLRKYDSQEVNIGVLIDFVMRIIASYCIYNFVRATRRFVK